MELYDPKTLYVAGANTVYVSDAPKCTVTIGIPIEHMYKMRTMAVMASLRQPWSVAYADMIRKFIAEGIAAIESQGSNWETTGEKSHG